MAPAAPQAQQSYNEENGTPVQTLVQWFEDAEEATTEARKQAERARDYYDGKQLTAKELETLKKRGQPDIIINRIQPKINFLIGFEAANRTDPKATPQQPGDEEGAEAVTDALRYLENDTELDHATSGVWENMLIEGFGGAELVVNENPRGDPDFEIVKWDWDRLFYDPHSRKYDFSDARYLGGVIWMDYEEAVQKWPDNVDVFERTWAERTSSQTYDDRPMHLQWTQRGSRRRVRIVQMYHLENGQWVYCVFTKGGKLDAYPVPFVDQDGRSWCPLKLQSAFVDRRNARYGLVNCMIGPQDEINKRRSKALHRLTMRQVRADKGAVDDVQQAKSEVAKPTGWIETNPGFQFEILDNSAQFAGEINLLQHAQNEIELMGPNAAMLGKDANAPSGRAIAMNQGSGQTEIGVLVDRLMQFKKRMHQGLWNLCRQYKKDVWWVKVTDKDESIKFVGFNRPVTMLDELKKRAEKAGMPPEMIDQRLQQMMQENPNAQIDFQQVVKTENVPTELNVDITIDQVPATASLMQEQFDALIKLAPVVPMPPTVYIKASSFRNKRELLDELKGPGPDPAQVKQVELGIAKGEAEIKKILAEAAKTEIEADMLQNPMGQIALPQMVEGQNTGPMPGSQPAPAGGEGVPPPGVTGDDMQNVPPTM